MIIRREEDLTSWQHEWANYHVLLAMTQLGVFDLLADNQPRTAEILADQLGADPRALDICARILVRVGLLHYDKPTGQFRLSETAHTLKESLNDLKREWRRRQNYADLVDTIHSGRPALLTSGGIVQDDEDDARQFLTTLHRTSTVGVQEAVKLLERLWPSVSADLPQKACILDLGGGHGRYAAAFAEAFATTVPSAHVTLFDREIATRIARDLSGNGFETHSGNLLNDDLGGPYTVVFTAFVVSGIGREDAQRLFHKLRGIVAPNGVLVIEDVFIDPVSHMHPDFAIDFQLTLLLENEHGRFRTIPEMVEMLTEAGFTGNDHVKVSGQDFGFLVAR